MRGIRPKKADVQRALERHMGNISSAARQLGCARATVYKALQRWPDLKAVVDEKREELADDSRRGAGGSDPPGEFDGDHLLPENTMQRSRVYGAGRAPG